MSRLPTSSQLDFGVLTMRRGKWTLAVITLLRGETRRFSELKRAGGISQKALTITLRELERDGFVTRTMFGTIPPRVDYALTDLGQELLTLADALQAFALRNSERMEAARARFDAHGGEPPAQLMQAR